MYNIVQMPARWMPSHPLMPHPPSPAYCTLGNAKKLSTHFRVTSLPGPPGWTVMQY